MEWIKSKFQKKEKSMNLQTDDEEGREEWGSPIDFFMSTLGYAGKTFSTNLKLVLN